MNRKYFRYMFAGMILGILVSLTTYNYIIKTVLLSGFGIIYIILDNLINRDDSK